MDTSTRSQTIHALPPDADPKALAPVPDINDSDVSQLTETEEFKAFLNKVADFATSQSNSPLQWERRRKSVKLRKYILGEYFGVFDKQKGWVSSKEEGDGIFFDPQTPTFVDSIVAQLVKARPIKICAARNPENVDKRHAAMLAQKLLEFDDLNDQNPKRQQREWKWNLLAAGETYRITYFNTEKPSYGVLEEEFEPKIIRGGDTAVYCPICSSVSADETGKCSNCGNPKMDEFRAMETQITVRKGMKYKQIGDVDYDVPDALEMTVIGDTDSIAEALIVMRDRMIPRCVLEYALKIENLPQTGTPDSLHYKQMFDQSRMYGSESMREFELLHYQEFWVAPAVYASYRFASDASLQGGVVIPKSTKAIELLPNGFYFSRVEKRITTLFPQTIAECLVHTVNTIGEGFHGQGEWDLSELQDQLTEAKSMKMNSMLLDSTQPLIFRSGYVDPNSFENKPGLIIPVEDWPMEQSLDNLMTRVRAGSAPSEAYQIGIELKGEMQQRIGAFSTQSDAPDIAAMGTATGIAAITEHALGRRGPAMHLYAFIEVEQAYQKLELRQKYWCKKMYDNVAREIGSDAVTWFMECNIRRDIAISVVPDSWMPRTDIQKQENLRSYLSLVGQIMTAKGDVRLLDEVLRKANEVFGAGLDFNDLEKEAAEAQLRLDKLREIGEFVEKSFGQLAYNETGGVNEEAIMLAYQQTTELLRLRHLPDESDPGDIFTSLPLDVMFDNHVEFEEVYTDWLKMAEGKAASLFIRTLAHKLAEYHIQAEAYRLMRVKKLQNLTELPDAEAAAIASDAEHAQRLEHTADQSDQALEMELARGILAGGGQTP